MNKYWLNKLIDVLMIQTNSENEKLMVLYLDRELRRLKLPYKIDAAGNILVVKGKAKTYPCVTSHMDTVHDFVNKFTVYENIDNKDMLFAMSGKRRVGIGGDDKCGVFGCLYLLETMPQIKVVFFSREEVSCKGSSKINKGFFSDCRYLIQLDRRGKSDFIQTYFGQRTISNDFSSEIGAIKKEYKYKNAIGTITDVMKLWYNGVGISCVNLSAGYYEPHSNTEYISISSLWNSVKFTEEIINNMKAKRYTSLPKEEVITGFHNNNSYTPIYDQCCKCKKWIKKTFLYEVKNSPKGEMACFTCKRDLYKKNKTNNTHEHHPVEEKINGSLKDNGIIFACSKCGIKTSEMKSGDSLRYSSDGKLYCSGCITLFDITDNEAVPKICYMCNKPIPKDQTPIKDEGASKATNGRYAYICEECNNWINNNDIVS